MFAKLNEVGPIFLPHFGRMIPALARRAANAKETEGDARRQKERVGDRRRQKETEGDIKETEGDIMIQNDAEGDRKEAVKRSVDRSTTMSRFGTPGL